MSTLLWVQYCMRVRSNSTWPSLPHISTRKESPKHPLQCWLELIGHAIVYMWWLMRLAFRISRRMYMWLTDWRHTGWLYMIDGGRVFNLGCLRFLPFQKRYKIQTDRGGGKETSSKQMPSTMRRWEGWLMATDFLVLNGHDIHNHNYNTFV